MRTSALQPNDEVIAKVRGYKFPARILDLDCRDIPGKPIRVEPLVPNVTFFHLSASQIDERTSPPPRAHRRPV